MTAKSNPPKPSEIASADALQAFLRERGFVAEYVRPATDPPDWDFHVYCGRPEIWAVEVVELQKYVTGPDGKPTPVETFMSSPAAHLPAINYDPDGEPEVLYVGVRKSEYNSRVRNLKQDARGPLMWTIAPRTRGGDGHSPSENLTAQVKFTVEFELRKKSASAFDSRFYAHRVLAMYSNFTPNPDWEPTADEIAGIICESGIQHPFDSIVLVRKGEAHIAVDPARILDPDPRLSL